MYCTNGSESRVTVVVDEQNQMQMECYIRELKLANEKKKTKNLSSNLSLQIKPATALSRVNLA